MCSVCVCVCVHMQGDMNWILVLIDGLVICLPHQQVMRENLMFFSTRSTRLSNVLIIMPLISAYYWQG